MNQHLDHCKLFAINAVSWIGTIASIEATKDILQIICLVGSLVVSGASVWWIKHQADVLDAKNKQE